MANQEQPVEDTPEAREQRFLETVPPASNKWTRTPDEVLNDDRIVAELLDDLTRLQERVAIDEAIDKAADAALERDISW